ncbi:hypothetical protein [Absidia glauca]|uniref:Uncharacterized protein n=1 Tax=Absidia glauca TaxID=4829 RepID=A0A163KCG1_ABSGL|nr:hypothetical protein [Absidia glauca]
MKFSLNSILLATGLLALLGATNAQDNGKISVFYEDGETVDRVDYNSCIPVTRQDGLKVAFAALESPGRCTIYLANNCSDDTEGPTKDVFGYGHFTPDDLMLATPNGAFKCTVL